MTSKLVLVTGATGNTGGHAVTALSKLGVSIHAPIAAQDQTRLIAAILVNPAPHSGKTYNLF